MKFAGLFKISTYKKAMKKCWNACTLENARHLFYFLTNLTAIGSAVAPLLPSPIKQIVGPVLGSLSFTSQQAVYRADNDELRSRIARHQSQYNILQSLLPSNQVQHPNFKAKKKKVSLQKFGVNPNHWLTIAATWGNIIIALAAGGTSSYMAYEALDEWNNKLAIGLGVGVVAAVIASSAAGVIEESFKKHYLKAIDKVYKSKVTAMKVYFANNTPQNLITYHQRVGQLSSNLKLKFNR